jgi:hypothetical protein
MSYWAALTMRVMLPLWCGALVGASVAVLSFFVVTWLLMMCIDSGNNLGSAITSLYWAAPFGLAVAAGAGLLAGLFAGARILRAA